MNYTKKEEHANVSNIDVIGFYRRELFNVRFYHCLTHFVANACGQRRRMCLVRAHVVIRPNEVLELHFLLNIR